MKICTFIGHKDTSQTIKPFLESVIKNLILNEEVMKFYVGTHGNFDLMVREVLKEIIMEYPQIDYRIVLAYIPKDEHINIDYSRTIYPDGLENVPLKFAIVERNKWMINNSDYLVCYIKNTFSNANKFKEFAKNKGLTIIEL